MNEENIAVEDSSSSHPTMKCEPFDPSVISSRVKVGDFGTILHEIFDGRDADRLGERFVIAVERIAGALERLSFPTNENKR